MALAQMRRTLLQNLYMYRVASTTSVMTAFQNHMCHTDSLAEIKSSFAGM